MTSHANPGLAELRKRYFDTLPRLAEARAAEAEAGEALDNRIRDDLLADYASRGILPDTKVDVWFDDQFIDTYGFGGFHPARFHGQMRLEPVFLKLRQDGTIGKLVDHDVRFTRLSTPS